MSWTKSLKRGVPLLDRKEGDLLLDALIDDAERGGERIDIRRVPAGIYMSDVTASDTNLAMMAAPLKRYNPALSSNHISRRR